MTASRNTVAPTKEVNTHITSKLLENSTKLFLLVALTLLCIGHRHARRGLWDRWHEGTVTFMAQSAERWRADHVWHLQAARAHTGEGRCCCQDKRVETETLGRTLILLTWCRFSPDNINDATDKVFGKEHPLSTGNKEINVNMMMI